MISLGFSDGKTWRVKEAGGEKYMICSLFLSIEQLRFDVSILGRATANCVVWSWVTQRKSEWKERRAGDIRYNGTTRGETVWGCQHLRSAFLSSFTQNIPVLEHSSGFVWTLRCLDRFTVNFGFEFELSSAAPSPPALFSLLCLLFTCWKNTLASGQCGAVIRI